MGKWIGIICLLIWSLAPLGALGADDQVLVKNVLEVLQKEKLDPQQSWKTTPILTGPNCSLNLAQLGTGVKGHYHRSHDEIVYIVRGNALVTIAEKEYKVWPGYAYVIPQGTIHSFVNLGPDPCAVLSIFSPAFDGKDRIFVE